MALAFGQTDNDLVFYLEPIDPEPSSGEEPCEMGAVAQEIPTHNPIDPVLESPAEKEAEWEWGIRRDRSN